MNEGQVPLDSTDAAILAALQADGRQSMTQLARTVSMSPSAVTERVRRLETTGVITGYVAVVDPERIGYPILAHLRLRHPGGDDRALHDLLGETPEVVSAHHVTGEDGFLLTVVATSMRHLEQVSGRVGALGAVTTSVVYSRPVPARAVLPPNARP